MALKNNDNLNNVIHWTLLHLTSTGHFPPGIYGDCHIQWPHPSCCTEDLREAIEIDVQLHDSEMRKLSPTLYFVLHSVSGSHVGLTRFSQFLTKTCLPAPIYNSLSMLRRYQNKGMDLQTDHIVSSLIYTHLSLCTPCTNDI